jgi:hypothetical protein
MAIYGDTVMFVNSGTELNTTKYRERFMKPKGLTDEPQLVGVDGAERMTTISRWTWRAWAYSGKVASVKAGRRLLIPVAEIRRVIEEGTRPRVEDSDDSQRNCESESEPRAR